jgi:hypothetical protein
MICIKDFGCAPRILIKSGRAIRVGIEAQEAVMKRVPRWTFLTAIVIVAGIAAGASQHAMAAGERGDTPEARRTTDALNMLEMHGYCSDLQEKKASAFEDFRPEGNNFAATIVQKNRRYTVVVNPETGRVTREN